MQKFRLYHYWRSSSSWRVRWALAYKGMLDRTEMNQVMLLEGEQSSEAHLNRNPIGLVPALEVIEEDGSSRFLAESNAIMEWLEESFPAEPLLPKDSFKRAQVRQLFEIVNAGMQPLMNISVQRFYSEDPEAKKRWSEKWLKRGFDAFEKILQTTAGDFCVGDELSFADLALIPQIYNANRVEFDLTPYPLIRKVDANAAQTPSWAASQPEKFKPEGFDAKKTYAPK